MQLLVMLALSLGILFILVMAGIVVAAVAMGAGADIDASELSGNRWLQAVSQLLTFALPVLLMTLIYYRGRQREYYRLYFGGRQWLNALAAVVILVLLMPAIDWITVWNDSWNLGGIGEKLRQLQDSTEGLIEQIMDTDTVAGLLGNLLVVALLPAVCEELFFRAGIQNLLQRWWSRPKGATPGQELSQGETITVGTHLAVWATAIIFSLAHGEIYSFMPRLLLGLLLGYLYVGSGSLLVNITVHFANNAIVVLVYWLSVRGVLDIDPEEPLRLNWILTACCSLAAVMAFVTTFGKKLKINR